MTSQLDPKGRGQEDFRGEKPNVYTATGSGALSLATEEPGRFEFIRATIKFSSKPSSSEDATLTLDANEGSVYDNVERRVTPADGTGTGDVVFKGNADDIFPEGDQLVLDFPNSDGRLFGAIIVVEPM